MNMSSRSLKTDMPPRKTKNSWSPWSQFDGLKGIEELWRKGFVEKTSFEPGVEERKSNGW